MHYWAARGKRSGGVAAGNAKGEGKVGCAKDNGGAKRTEHPPEVPSRPEPDV